MWKPMRTSGHAVPILLLVALACMSTSVQSAAASSEWPPTITEEYTTAWLNITFKGRNGTVSEKSQSGRFGKGGKIGGVSGVVIHVKTITNGSINHFGCGTIINEPPDENWIALVRRGSCEFDTKLRHVFAKKAVAMVVYDREISDNLEDMKISPYTIPAVFTYKITGEKIANLTDSGIRVEMHITVGEVCSRAYSGINRPGASVEKPQCVFKRKCNCFWQFLRLSTSVLFVSISFIVLMVISLAWLIFYYIQRFRYLHAKDRLAQRLCCAAKKALAKIPTRNVKQLDKEVNDGECCAVCIEYYKPGDILRTLPCRHEFHKTCVDPWLLEHRTCPMCKMDILKYYGYIFTGSQESILHLDMEDGGLNSSDSRDTESPTNENTVDGLFQHAPNHHMETISTDDNSQHGDIEKSSSLISLAVVTNECITPNPCSDALVSADATGILGFADNESLSEDLIGNGSGAVLKPTLSDSSSLHDCKYHIDHATNESAATQEGIQIDNAPQLSFSPTKSIGLQLGDEFPPQLETRGEDKLANVKSHYHDPNQSSSVLSESDFVLSIPQTD